MSVEILILNKMDNSTALLMQEPCVLIFKVVGSVYMM